ncbi:MAG TPA: hypothetical protein VFX13_13645 [Gaiellales bacterium]|nr:hypothetical protein [Gaiellales bacterium]
MVSRSRGMVAASGLGAAVVAVYAVLGAIALTSPTPLSVPGFGSVVRAEVGFFTAPLMHSRPAQRSHVLAAVVNVPPPAAPAAVQGSVSSPAPAPHGLAPKGRGGQQPAVTRHERRQHRHSHHHRNRHRHRQRGHEGHGRRHHHHWSRHRHAHQPRRDARPHRAHVRPHRAHARHHRFHARHEHHARRHHLSRSGGCRRHRHVGLPRHHERHGGRHHHRR